MPRFAESNLERNPTAATFRGNTSSTLMTFDVSSYTMRKCSKFTEDHHKTDDGDRCAEGDLRESRRNTAKVTTIPVTLGPGVAGRLGWHMAPK